MQLETTPARYSLSHMDAAAAAVGSDADSLTRHRKAGVARRFQRLKAGSSSSSSNNNNNPSAAVGTGLYSNGDDKDNDARLLLHLLLLPLSDFDFPVFMNLNKLCLTPSLGLYPVVW